MTGRTALVTGGTGAIGRELCRRLHEAGYRVAANCYPADEDNARGWIAECEADGIRIHLEAFDVADYEAANDGVRRVEDGVGPVDVLVNAAGITRDATLVKMEPDSWSSVLRTNLDSAYNVTRPVVAGMVSRGFGRKLRSADGMPPQWLRFMSELYPNESRDLAGAIDG